MCFTVFLERLGAPLIITDLILRQSTPIDGTVMVAKGQYNALSVIAAANVVVTLVYFPGTIE